jgi:hypothetical protein
VGQLEELHPQELPGGVAGQLLTAAVDEEEALAVDEDGDRGVLG